MLCQLRSPFLIPLLLHLGHAQLMPLVQAGTASCGHRQDKAKD
jgi:hypothetical protein